MKAPRTALLNAGQILRVLDKLPITSKNIVSSSGVDAALGRLQTYASASPSADDPKDGSEAEEESDDARADRSTIAVHASALLAAWEQLKTVFVIPKSQSSASLAPSPATYPRRMQRDR